MSHCGRPNCERCRLEAAAKDGHGFYMESTPTVKPGGHVEQQYKQGCEWPPLWMNWKPQMWPRDLELWGPPPVIQPDRYTEITSTDLRSEIQAGYEINGWRIDRTYRNFETCRAEIHWVRCAPPFNGAEPPPSSCIKPVKEMEFKVKLRFSEPKYQREIAKTLQSVIRHGFTHTLREWSTEEL